MINCLMVGWSVVRLVSWSTGQPIVGRPNGQAAGQRVGLPLGQARQSVNLLFGWPVNWSTFGWLVDRHQIYLLHLACT